MVYQRALQPPNGREPLARLRHGREGVWWERGDGLQVRVAAPEHEPLVQRSRLSLLAMMVAYVISERAQGDAEKRRRA
jgi:hypothetical protein